MKVLITRSIPSAGIDMLDAKGYEIVVNPHDRPLKKAELISMGQGASAVISMLTDKITRSVMKKIGPQLKIVANYAVGYDNIDVAASKKLGIHISNTPTVLTDSVAEHTIALMMAISKRLVEADRFMRRGKYKGWKPDLLLGTEFQKKTIGVIGLGRIGKSVVRMASRAFNMQVLYQDVKRDEAFEQEYGARYVPIEELLRSSDYVSVHVPLLESTRHLINAEKLSMMKTSAYLINTSRGPVVDEVALYEVLEQKKIRGAAIDVFEYEPKLAGTSALTKRARALDNLIVTPHTASATIEARDEMARLAAQNVIAALENQLLVTPVN
ncbi:MAG: D-isomer specific 2-hydroxyacid dehydrogenase [Parcubacteria group bacterium Gr01-1014_18]|nr:MAG: D-isomer specific 2-hydroxyacid dehydrogenase [Parcubacteria group bacterium Greene0416_36]TSC80205.1 MAG: D-isomer specific 2-hydroxyacid dehydrogenase [Parcubacteria group bacterium Gr01-1014_18]TSC98387.1 MAG: D-isomer specific 2-hydroxyacid dehydrogenase [Parcubacteria group bacterium Greene1014_20]TSD06928.1 MAG: D-isomer specific 2-hydroxyacid dehydrogenase [Parcubacteria group bacterium Greene0714_2]